MIRRRKVLLQAFILVTTVYCVFTWRDNSPETIHKRALIPHLETQQRQQWQPVSYDDKESMNRAHQQRINDHWAHAASASGLVHVADELTEPYKDPLDQLVVSNALEFEHRQLLRHEHKMLELELPKYNDLQEPSVVILSASDNHAHDIVQMALENRRQYAQLHGYRHHFVNLSKYTWDESVVWLKIPAIREAFDTYPEAEWVWWLDIDAIIMNTEVKLGDHLLRPEVLKERLAYGHPLRNTTSQFEGQKYLEKDEVDMDDIDLIISQDPLGLNAGSFFIRRSYFTDLLLDLWADPVIVQRHWERQEQDALIHILLTHKSLLKHVGLVPQRLLNAYHDNSFSHMWRYHPGDFVIHFAGVNADKGYVQLWNSYWNQRMLTPPLTPDDSKEFLLSRIVYPHPTGQLQLSAGM